LKLLRGQDRARYRAENRWLRDAARKLSAQRDADTTAAAFHTLLEQPGVKNQRRKFAPLVRALNARRAETGSSHAKIERKVTRFSERLESAEVRLSCWEPEAGLDSIIRQHRRAYKRARAGLVAARELGTATAFHEWRKAVKTYAYQCRLLRAAWPPAMKELRDELKELASLLGDEHDLTMLRKTLKQIGQHPVDHVHVDDDLVAAAIECVEARRAELRVEAIPLGERLFVDRPRVIAERMMQWWTLAQKDGAASVE
jgi:CHAD domain-containing protein